MEVILYTIPAEEKSAKKLGFEVFTSLFDSVDNYNEKIIVRWGNSSPSYKLCPEQNGKKSPLMKIGRLFIPAPIPQKPAEFKNVVNPSKGISLNVDKLISLKELSKIVNTPQIYEKDIPKDKLVVLRPKKHTGGENFTVQKGPFSLIDKNWYGTGFISTQVEYRVFFCGDKTMMTRRINHRKSRDRSKFKCRSLYGYWRFTQVPKNLHDMVLRAAKQLGLDFGCFDILKRKDRYYFLEGNTAPSLDYPRIVNFYKNGLKLILKEKFGYKVEKMKKEEIVKFWD